MKVVVKRERKNEKKQRIKLGFCDKCQRGTGCAIRAGQGWGFEVRTPKDTFQSSQVGPTPAGPLSAEGDASAGTMLALHWDDLCVPEISTTPSSPARALQDLAAPGCSCVG